MAVVYLHRTKDTGEVFYIGIGKTEKRAYSKATRNKLWLNVIEKHNYEVEILYRDLSWEEACKLEVELINKLGRRDLGTGCLVNMTSGGDGLGNPSEETRAKIGAASKGRTRTPEASKKAGRPGEQNINFGKFGAEHPKYGKPGRKWTEEQKLAHSKKTKGRVYPVEMRQNWKTPKGPQVLRECPYCKKVGGHAMTRWHFENCKQKKLYENGK